MELDLGLKITKTKDDITSVSEVRLAKDRAGPVFLSRETNTMFILTAYLKGYKRNNINIMISEDGSRISISGEKPIQEMVRIGLVVCKKDVDIKGFKKVFRIPDGVILDRIEAKYNGEESVLKIFMPKSVKGICGVGIEELKEEERDTGKLEPKQNEADQIPQKIGETSQRCHEVSKDSGIQQIVETQIAVENMDGGESEKMPIGDHGLTEETRAGEIKARENGEPILETQDECEESKDGFDGLKTSEPDQHVADHIPDDTFETKQDVREESDVQQDKETEGDDKQMNGGETKRMLPDISKVRRDDTDGEGVREEVAMEEFEAAKTADEKEFSGESGAAIVDKIEQVEKTTTEDEHPLEKVTGVQETSQVEANGGFSEDSISDATKEDLKETKTEGKDQGQQCVQEEIKEEEDKRKCDETKVAEKEESETKEKIQESGTEGIYEIKQMAESLQKVPETKRPQELDLGSPQREIPPTIDTGTYPKVARARCEEDEKGHVKDQPGTKRVSPPEIQRKDTHDEDQKPMEKEEIQECDCGKLDENKHIAETMQKTPKKELSRVSEVVEREGEPHKASVAFPEITSMDCKDVKPKSKIEEPNFKGLPLPTTEMQSKEREGCGHHIEVTKTPETDASEGARPSEVQSLPLTQQSILEERGKSETKDEASRESPKETSEVKFQEPNKMTTQEDEETRTLETHDLADGCIEEREEFGSREAACGRKDKEKVCERRKGTEIVMEDRAQQQMQEKIDEEGFETTEVADEELMKREHVAQTLPHKSEGPKPTDTEESKEVSKLSIKTTPTVEDKKSEIKETTPQFGGENFQETKQVSGKMQETHKREHVKDPMKAPPGNGAEPPETKATHQKAKSEELKEVKPKTESEKLQTKENAEGSSIHVQAGKGISDADHLKAMNVGFKKDEPKGDTDKSLTKELAHPTEEMLSIEAYELVKPSMEQDTSEAEIVPHLGEEKEPSNSIQGSEASEDVADKVARPSTLPSQPSTKKFEVQGEEQTDECYDGTQGESQELPCPPSNQRFKVQGKEQTDEFCDDTEDGQEVLGKEQTDECYEGTHGAQELPSLPFTQTFEVQGKEQADKCYDGTHGEFQESAQMKSHQQVEGRETSQPEFSADQQDVNYDLQIIGKEESCGEQMILEETGNEQADRGNEASSQEDCRVAAADEIRDDKRRSKKLCAPLIIVGSAMIVSVIVFFIRRARKSTKYYSK